jgi:hypothetical protein
MDQHQVIITATKWPVIAGSYAIVDTEGLDQESAVLDWYTAGDTSIPSARDGIFVPWPCGLVQWSLQWSIVAGNFVAYLMTTDDQQRAITWAAQATGATEEDLVVAMEQSANLSGKSTGIFTPRRYVAARVQKDALALSASLTLTSRGIAERGPSAMKLATLGKALTPANLL